MSRKERKERRKKQREEGKEDKKDLKSIMDNLSEKYATDREALKEAVDILLSVAAFLASLSQPVLTPPYAEIMGFLTNTKDEEEEAKKAAEEFRGTYTGPILIPSSDKIPEFKRPKKTP